MFRLLHRDPAAEPSSDTASFARGSTVNYDVRGSNLQPGARVIVSGTGVTAAVTDVNWGRMTVSVTVAPDAVAGARSFTVINSDGGRKKCTNCWTVT